MTELSQVAAESTEPHGGRLDAMLRSAARAGADRLALIDGDVRTTYRELLDSAERTAQLLRAKGITPGDTVAVVLDRGAPLVTALAAVVLSGGAHLAVDPADPLERLRYLLGASGARLLVTDRNTGSRLDICDLGVPIVVLDDIPEEAGDPAAGLGSPEDPAYLIFTSGSTGVPKATLVPHRAIAGRMAWTRREIGLTPDDRVLLRTPTGFDVFVAELYLTLTTGATLVIAEPGRQADPAYLVRTIASHQVTTVYTVPSFIELLLGELGEQGRLDALRTVFVGGEPLRPQLVQQFHRHFSATLLNMYGPTECTVYCTFWRCPRDPELDRVLIGGPVDDTELRVLDAGGEPVAPGETGELYVGGSGVALGYANQPELTAERFVDGGRWYRTGDLVRWTGTGELEYVGRADDQVKVRGHRAEPGEVEAALLRIDGVEAAAVVPDDSLGDTRLVAFVVAPGAGGTEDSVRLRHRLAEWLPTYLVPAAVEFLPGLPLSINEKVDRTRLRRLAATVRGGSGEEAPTARTGTAALIAARWCARLDVADVADDADFFELGGNSIMAARVSRDISRELGVPVPVGMLFDAPTLGEFTNAVTRLSRAS